MLSFLSSYDWDLYCSPIDDMLELICPSDREILSRVFESYSFIFYRTDLELGKLLFDIKLLFFDEITAVSKSVHVRSPLLCILFGLDFEFISDSLAFEFPIILADSTDDDLFVFINGCISTHIFPIVHLLFFAHLNFIHHFIALINFLVGILRFFFF